MGVTHVLNAAHGTAYSHGGKDFYGATIDYYGVPAHDLPSFDISQFFFSAAQFIHNALNTPGDSFFTKLRKRVSEPKQYPERVGERSEMPHTRDSSSPTGSAGSRASYETPALTDLQRLFWFRGGSDNHVDQVWPNIYLGDAWAARSKTTLQSLNITHILNAADGPYSINTGAKYYEDLQIEYYGVEAFDDPSFDLSIFFYDAANFIGKALNTSGGKVFVHCAMGVSRSASLVLAFLMIHENMTLVDALKTVSAHRDICPNSGFLSQLRDLDIKLNEERKGTRASATEEL
ncbi:DS13B phosphatase, partial [Trogon melanurus]|nr:DS13B phosphatase [Trogon melanurus]